MSHDEALAATAAEAPAPSALLRVLRGPLGLWIFDAPATLIGAALWWLALTHVRTPVAPVHLTWWMLLPFFYAADRWRLDVPAGEQNMKWALTPAAVALGLFLSSPLDLLIADTAVAPLIVGISGLRHPEKLFDNLVNDLFGVACAVLVFNALRPAGVGIGFVSWPIVLLAVVVYAAAAYSTIPGALWVIYGYMPTDWILPSVRVVGVICCIGCLWAVTSATMLWTNPETIVLVLANGAMVIAGFRMWSSERRHREVVDFIHGSGSILNTSQQLEEAVVTTLQQARTSLLAQFAEVIIVPTQPGEKAFRTTVHQTSGVQSMVPVELADGDVVDIPQGVIVNAATTTDPQLRALIERRGVRDALYTPLRRGEQLVGTLFVGGHSDSTGRDFGVTELKAFQASAQGLASRLDSSHLERIVAELSSREAELTHRVLHDPMTGLANRLFFNERVEAAARSAEGELMAVLFIDLDNFKGVNDTYGHAAGDLVLVTVAQRLRECLRGADTAARLGGDEFAVILEHVKHPGEAARVGERILEAVREPVFYEGHHLPFGASIGAAVSPTGGADHAGVVRTADEAMYEAKRRGKGTLVVRDLDGGAVPAVATVP